VTILSLFDLKGAQVAAAARLDVHLAVTAGAGSGKTRALVGRYLHFVEQGAPLRSLIAITFTEKAAREMRSRIRREIEQWLNSPLPSALLADGRGAGGEGEIWQRAFIDLDSARIGTIHSLCADLLRLYPAEAGVDPRFTVLEEGRAALLQAEAVDSALAWAANEHDVVRVFAAFKENELRRLLTVLLLKRLDAAPLFQQPDPLARWEAELTKWLDGRFTSEAWASSLAALAEYSSPKSDDKLELARRAVLTHWQTFQAAQTTRDWDAAFTALRELRDAISTGGVKINWEASGLEAMREAMKTLRDDYDTHLKPLLKDETRWELDQQAAALLPALRRLFDRALTEYQFLKDQFVALDFDDLEDRAVHLLAYDSPLPTAPFAVGRGVGGEGVRAILVDEFQDTNDRQRQIVYALAGFSPLPSGSAPTGRSETGPGVRAGGKGANLFIVGDAKQGIYRFRGADVTVFRDIQTDIVQLGGEKIDLDLTFRAHQPLLQTVEQLLSPLMGNRDDSARPYHVPFAPLTAYREQPRQNTRAPFVELQLGIGEDADVGRRAAAYALAARLPELRAQEGLAWEDMALLFRASTAFPVYEDALEAAGIPFVTVAGKGFYDRPEIRDLLNALTTIADPSDDLALAGLLRSPAFALTDADLYHLRFPNGDPTPSPLYNSLHEASNPPFSQTAEVITYLHSLSGRLPVAELLKHFLDVTHYRAILKAGGSSRLSRNVDKLLADAHRSRLVAADDFLEYVRALRDVGAREGEAPAEVGGAVQLMTVHKSKGLEFSLVVIADAAYSPHGGGGDNVQLNPELGVLLKLKAQAPQRVAPRPVAWQLGALADEDRAASEDLRLLYVAATRAKDKLLVNGHAKISAAKNAPGKLILAGWLKQLGDVIGLDDVRLKTEPPEVPLALNLKSAWAEALSVTVYPPAPEVATRPMVVADESPIITAPGSLSVSLTVPQASIEVEARDRVWRVIAGGRSAPAWVVGKLTHEALRRWTFVDLATRLRPAALATGLTEASAIGEALRETRQLLERFHAHPLFVEMDQAVERHQELPYVLGDDAGVIDVLYRVADEWVVADFKTDDLRDESALARVLPEYRAQLRRYAEAVTAQLHLPALPRAQLIFLNWQGEVRVIRLQANRRRSLLRPLARLKASANSKPF
jgi:ATP-dependent helicase/nuclease subunit A